MNTKILTQKELKRLFEYDQVTGEFIRRQTVAQQVKGTVAGSENKQGYKRIRIDGKYYYCHRLAFLYLYAAFPNGVVDHVDGNPSNNSIANLRCVSKSENAQNIKRSHLDSKSKKLGVWFHSQANRYASQITIEGKRISLGLFDTPELAHIAYLKAKRNLHIGCTI